MQTHRDDDHEGVKKLRDAFRAVDPEKTEGGSPGDFGKFTEKKMRELKAALEERAVEMVAAGKSQITSGRVGERALGMVDKFGVRTTRLPDDELALRVSIGKVHGVVGPSRYLTFRGDPEEVASLVTRAALVMQHYLKVHREAEKRKAGKEAR